MVDASPCITPMSTVPKLSKDQGVPFSDPKFYRTIVGGLQYLSVTGPDICYAVNRVCQFMAAPTLSHWQAVKRLLRYLKGTSSYGLIFRKPTNLKLTAFSDADWATDIDDRRSTSGFCVYFGGNLISWSSKKQQVVSRSSTEAEYRSLAAVVAEISWIKSLLQELRITLSSAPTVYCDNISAVHMTANPILHARTKHVELDIHFVREKAIVGEISVLHVPSTDQVADGFTKPLSKQLFLDFRSYLMIGDRNHLLEGG